MMLMAQVPFEKGKEITQSFLTFDEAFSLFLAFSPSKSHLALQQKHERKHFKEFICHPRYGLCVYVVGELFVVLKPDNIDIENFIEALIMQVSVDSREDEKNHRLELDHETVSDLTESMDTEWNKNVLRVVLRSSLSKKEINKIGIDSHEIKKLTENVVSVTQERKKAKYAATDMVKLRIQSQIEITDNNIKVKEQSLKKKQYNSSQIQIDEINDEIYSLMLRRNELEKLKAPTTKYEKKRVKEMIKRTQYSLIRENRVGMRKKSMGRLLSMDEVDETFLLNCIESKPTAHGRRGDQVMHTGRRV